MKSLPYVLLYLGAIIAANLTTAAWGPDWSIVNAFLLVGLILTTRDRLHDLWAGNRLRNMAALILAGSAVSYAASILLADSAIPSDVVARIALASCAAFAAAETMDALTYHRVRFWPWLERSNLSNFVGAAVDSTLFVSIAFGWDWRIVFGQFTAKVAGGLLWSFVYDRYSKLSDQAAELVREAKCRGLLAHMGRVNTRQRVRHAAAIGCDSFDGTSYSKWRRRRLPEGLDWAADAAAQTVLDTA